MNIEELEQILQRENFNPRAYSLEGGLPNERLCFSNERSRWCVYYSERGLRTDEKCYTSEDEACRDLLQRLCELPESQSKIKR